MKKWNGNDINDLIIYLKENKTNKEISKLLKRSESSIKNKVLKEKLCQYRIDASKIYIEKKCLNCNKIILKSDYRSKFCNHSCSATYNNKKRIFKKENNKLVRIDEFGHVKYLNICINCNTSFEINKNTIRKYCSNKCQKEYQKKMIFEKIESGDTTLDFRQYKSYLIHKHGEKCMVCGWNEINPYTNTIPIELEHIDGNSDNNSLDNLLLLCPNHHSLTKTSKGANKGNGRYKRRQRYKEGKSY